jgi:hypothetical protein
MFYSQEFMVGEMALDALEVHAAQGAMAFIRDIYAVLGDPALQVRPGQYTRQIERGNANEELAGMVVIRKARSGAGSLISGSLQCGSGCEVMVIPHVSEESVLVDAIPAADSYFAGWRTSQGYVLESIHYAQPGDIVIAIFNKRSQNTP